MDLSNCCLPTSLPDGPEKLAFMSVCGSFFRETGAKWDLRHYVCVFAESIAGRTGNIMKLQS